MITDFQYFFRHFINIVYPVFCAVCACNINENPGIGICESCLKKIQVNVSPFCPECGFKINAISQSKQPCVFCKDTHYNFDRALNVCGYQGIAKTCIHLFKYKRKIALGVILADIMTRFLKEHATISEIDIVSAVPLHSSKIRERGFNQADIFAVRISDSLKLAYSSNNLCRVRKTRSQFSLNKKQRAENLAEAFTCKDAKQFRGKSVLLIDDIFTTGATFNECARVLKQAGARRVIAVSMAR